MGKNELRIITIMTGSIGLLMGLFTLIATVLAGTGQTWSTYLALILNIGQILGSIFSLFITVKISNYNRRKYIKILLIVASFCFVNDFLYKTLINTFSGIAFVICAFLIYKFKVEG